MKRTAFLIVVTCMGFVSMARAQDHIEVGAFAEYFKLHQTGTNFAGLGARAGINVLPHVQIEAEMSYDFNQVFTEGYTDNGTGTVTTQNSNIRILHGLIGPKIQTTGPVRVFFTLKGGATNFRLDPRPASFDTFSSSVENIRGENVSAALYPGAGVEAFLGPIGLRAEVGDEIIFVNGPHNNWKASIGPQLRF